MSDELSFAQQIAQCPTRDQLETEVNCLIRELGLVRWSALRPWAENNRPQLSTDEELELLIERLHMLWVEKILKGEGGNDG